ncbi:hypothetical protein ACU8KH_03527 [Lachancea thermotolerans]
MCVPAVLYSEGFAITSVDSIIDDRWWRDNFEALDLFIKLRSYRAALTRY